MVSMCLEMIVLSGHVPQANAVPNPAGADQRGERFIPNTFFGVTTHVNREGSMRGIKWLNMRTVRLDFPMRILQAADGGHQFSGNFVTDSADLGAKLNLDQMALIGHVPRTFPDDQSVKAFEENIEAFKRTA